MNYPGLSEDVAYLFVEAQSLGAKRYLPRSGHRVLTLGAKAPPRARSAETESARRKRQYERIKRQRTLDRVLRLRLREWDVRTIWLERGYRYDASDGHVYAIDSADPASSEP